MRRGGIVRGANEAASGRAIVNLSHFQRQKGITACRLGKGHYGHFLTRW
jgi:hypothetical protein